MVHSPLIKKVLDGTFEGFHGLNTRLKQLTFNAPFHPFYYRQHRFEKLRQHEQDPVARSHLDFLYSVLGKELLPHIEAMKNLLKNGIVSFDTCGPFSLPIWKSTPGSLMERTTSYC